MQFISSCVICAMMKLLVHVYLTTELKLEYAYITEQCSCIILLQLCTLYRLEVSIIKYERSGVHWKAQFLRTLKKSMLMCVKLSFQHVLKKIAHSSVAGRSCHPVMATITCQKIARNNVYRQTSKMQVKHCLQKPHKCGTIRSECYKFTKSKAQSYQHKWFITSCFVDNIKKGAIKQCHDKKHH